MWGGRTVCLDILAGLFDVATASYCMLLRWAWIISEALPAIRHPNTNVRNVVEGILTEYVNDLLRGEI
jgi:hypothetical protein